ncbi:MAG: glycosyltransferase family 4 protein [Candidatus Nanohalobium sp.]
MTFVDRVLTSAADNGFDVCVLTFDAEVVKNDIIEVEGVPELFSRILRSQADYIYMYNSYWPNWVLPLLGVLSGKDIIYAPHCSGFHKLQGVAKNIVKRSSFLLFSDRVTLRCLSKYEKDIYTEFLPESNVFYCPYAIDEKHFSNLKPKIDSKQLFSLANARKFKDVETQIRALYIVEKEYPEAQLNIIGGWSSEEYRDRITMLIEDLNLEENVEIHGFVPREKMFELMSNCEAFIHASKFETQGLAIYEAAAAGFPICVSDVPVHNQNFERFKHPQGDHEALADDIKTIFGMDEEEKQEISEEMRELAKDFSYEKEMERLREFFKELDSNC